MPFLSCTHNNRRNKRIVFKLFDSFFKLFDSVDCVLSDHILFIVGQSVNNILNPFDFILVADRYIFRLRKLVDFLGCLFGVSDCRKSRPNVFELFFKLLTLFIGVVAAEVIKRIFYRFLGFFEIAFVFKLDIILGNILYFGNVGAFGGILGFLDSVKECLCLCFECIESITLVRG